MRARICSALSFCLFAISLQADSVVMQNGDRYNGKLLSVTSSNVFFQSDVLGTVKLSRSQVVSMAFGTNAPVNSVSATASTTNAPAKSNTTDELSATLRQLGAYTNLIQKVQSQFLAAAGPEANEKFSQMLNDLTTGKMTIADLRAQAKAVADQLRSLQSEAGEDASGTADLYLSLLDRFLGDTGSAGKTTTNSPAPR